MDDTASTPTGAQRTTALVMATLGFAVNFWAWSLLSPLGPVFVEDGITQDASLLVAIPVLVGSLGRIVVGALTDRFGGRLMMPTISLITIIPVLFIGFIGQYTYATLLIGGFFLGVGGTSFAIGVPYVNSWFPKERRGTATGIYGIGMGGTAIAAFTTVPLFEQGALVPFIVTAAALLIYALVALALMKNHPDWRPSEQNIGRQMAGVMKLPFTWQACYLYALSFGGYVAFSVYLPTYLMNAYGLEAGDAALRMAGFVVAAVIMRPIGGMLSDKIGPIITLLGSYTIVLLCALSLATNPRLEGLGTVAFLLMAIGLGLGAGAVFALVAQVSDPSQVGSITGFVGAAGGLGGFVPPLLLGGLWAATQEYRWGLLLLAAATILAGLITLVTARGMRPKASAEKKTQRSIG
ncbi:MAG TPA: NarK/NasA family nitrate transporter [Enteractinococcus sp.]